MGDTLRVLFFGMEGVFSQAPLVALLASEFKVVAVVVPAPARFPGLPPIRLWTRPPRWQNLIPLGGSTPPPTITTLTWDAGIPVYDVSRLKHPQTLMALAALQPDVLCVACFPRLLPTPLFEIPRVGGFNVHPSLLPQFRGPEPLFWTFHTGLEHAGVTIHRLDSGADTGPIAAQAPIVLPDGIHYNQAEHRCSELGARLLVDTLRRAAAGALVTQPQSEADASFAPRPGPDDFVITPDWSARRAYNFVAGLADWGQPIWYDTGTERLQIAEALSFKEHASQANAVVYDNGLAHLRGSSGALTAILTSPA